MTHPAWARRTFLKRASQGLAVLPLLPSLSALSETQKSGKHREESAPPKPTVKLNVKDLGAKGDGTTKDTLALQQALDRCSVLGGGEVLLPSGEYLTGALFLRSNTTLRIEEGASLMGSPVIADYPMTQVVAVIETRPFSPRFTPFPPVAHEDVDVLGRKSSVLEQITHYTAGSVDWKWEEFSGDTNDPFSSYTFRTALRLVEEDF